MKSFALATLAAVAVATPLPAKEFEFMKYVAKWNKSYATVEEFKHRLAQYMRLDAFIEEVNAPGSDYTHTAAHNKFSDFTVEEFNKLMTLKDVDDKMPVATETYVAKEVNAVNPNCSSLDNCDYRNGACTTPVKDQGQCGSCWAFSATESVESAQCLAGNGLAVLSPQQLVDCATVTQWGNQGCSGGWYYYAWDYLKVNGQMSNADYPYTAMDGTCKYVASKGIAQVTSYAAVAYNSTQTSSMINANMMNAL